MGAHRNRGIGGHSNTLLSAIEHAFQPLLHTPLMGPRREHLGAGLRVIFHDSYATYYLPATTEVVIVRVPHGAREAVAIANQGGFVQ